MLHVQLADLAVPSCDLGVVMQMGGGGGVGAGEGGSQGFLPYTRAWWLVGAPPDGDWHVAVGRAAGAELPRRLLSAAPEC